MGSHPRGTPRLEADHALRFGRRVAAWRALNGVEAQDLARVLRLTRTGMSQLENGRRVVTVELARRVESWTGVTLDGDGVAFSDKGLWHGQVPAAQDGRAPGDGTGEGL